MTDTKHTDSVETTIEEILNDNRGETLYDSENANEIAADAIDNFIEAVLPKLQAHTSQQVEEAVLQADATGAYHSGYLAGKAEVEEAVRKEREGIKAVITQVREKYGLDIPDEVDSIDYDTGSDVADDIEQALNPNHQD